MVSQIINDGEYKCHNGSYKHLESTLCQQVRGRARSYGLTLDIADVNIFEDEDIPLLAEAITDQEPDLSLINVAQEALSERIWVREKRLSRGQSIDRGHERRIFWLAKTYLALNPDSDLDVMEVIQESKALYMRLNSSSHLRSSPPQQQQQQKNAYQSRALQSINWRCSSLVRPLTGCSSTMETPTSGIYVPPHKRMATV